MPPTLFPSLKPLAKFPLADGYQFGTIEASILEGTAFTRNEIMALIYSIACDEGLNPADLEIASEYYNRQNVLMALSVRVLSQVALGFNLASIGYQFVLRNDSNSLGSLVTNVIRTSDADHPELIKWQPVAQFDGYEWIVRPDRFFAQRHQDKVLVIE